jgi:hypothetical protein
VRLVTVAGIATAWRATPTRAAEVDFRPSLTFGLAHDGNILIVGTDKLGDDHARLGLDLHVDRRTRTSSMTFAYLPEYVKYRNRSDLDFFGNTLVFGYTDQFSPRTKLAVNADVARTDTQGVTSYNVDRPSTLVPRTTVTRGFASAVGSVGVGPRALVDWQVRGAIDRYKDVAGVTFQDSSSLALVGGWRDQLSERQTLGLALMVEGFGYSSASSVIVETLGLTGTYKAGRVTDLTYAVGATHSTSEGISSTNGAFSLAVTRSITDVSTLNAGASQSVNPGTGLSGASLDTGAWIGYTHTAPRRGITGTLYGAYWYRAGVDLGATTAPATDTADVTGTLGWNFNRFLALHVGASWTYQNTRSTTASGALDTQYGSYGLTLHWAIRGR